MAYVKNLFDKNFIEYASYVIRDRAIPDLEDGLKPVQRRILHTLFNMDDGRFQKAANVVGRCMMYHPHGDASIAGALVVLANKGGIPNDKVGLFIEKQGNFGNVFTGDEASASRYIECRVRPLAKEIFVTNPAVTHYIPNYDGRSTEPEVYRAKIPVALLVGAEGIAVGMSTKILPYNLKEVLEAEVKALKNEDFEIYPDVQTGGLIDVSNYNDGNGKIISRAKLDLSDEKRIVITELPVDTNAQDLKKSIDDAFKAGRLKISSVQDLTTNHCHIEIKLPRGVYAKDVEKALYAYTDCEKSISCQMLVIKDNMPTVMTATEIIKYYAKKLTAIIKDELIFEQGKLSEELHARTLERIFIEERIYKKIEQMKTAEDVDKAVKKGFVPFKDELLRPVSDEDVERLLKIPIRRISLFDINKNKDQVAAINKQLKDIARKLKHLTQCAVDYLNGMLTKFRPEEFERHTQIASFNAVDVKAVAKRDITLRYDEKGYLGSNVIGGAEVTAGWLWKNGIGQGDAKPLKVTPYDRIFIMRRSGIYTVCDVPEKLFVDTGLWYCNLAEKDIISSVLFTVIYRDPRTKFCFIKRCRIPSWIMNRDYLIVPDGMEVLHIDIRGQFNFTLHYTKKPRQKIQDDQFNSADFEEKGHKTQGVRLSSKETDSVIVEPANPQMTLL